MPTLVRFLAFHAVIGFLIAIALVTALIVLDAAGLRTLAMASAGGPIAIACLALVLGFTFASVQMGFAVMLLGQSAKDDGGLPDASAERLPVESARGVVRK